MTTIGDEQAIIRTEMFAGNTNFDDLILRAIGETIDAIQYAVDPEGKPVLWKWLETRYQSSFVNGVNSLLATTVSPPIKDINYISVIGLDATINPLSYMDYEPFLQTYYNATNDLPQKYSVVFPSTGATLYWGPTPNSTYTFIIDYYQRHPTTSQTTILVPDLELVKRGAKMRVALDQDNAEVAKMNLDIYDRLFANLMSRQQRFETPRFTVPVY